MSRVRVLLLLSSLRPGGAEKMVLALAKGLDRTKFTPVVCGMRTGGLLEAFRRLDMALYILGKRGPWDLRAAWKLYRVIHRKGIQIIHSNNFSSNMWGRVIGKLAGVPVVIATEHTVASAKSRLQMRIDVLLAPFSDKIVAVSNRVRDSHISEEGLPPEKMVTIYNGIDPWKDGSVPAILRRQQVEKEFSIPSSHRIATTVGRLEPPKGYEILIRAVPLVLASCPDTCFLIVGDGYLRKPLESLARTLGVADKVIWTGFRQDARALLACSDLCVIPSVREGFSLTLLEAMSAGKPIVATEVGGNAEAITHGQSGILVEPGDPTALARAIITTLKNRHLAEDMARQARTRFERYFTDTLMTARYENLYESFRPKLRRTV